MTDTARARWEADRLADAVARAISGRPTLHRRGGRWFDGERSLSPTAPHLGRPTTTASETSGLAPSVARPTDPSARPEERGLADAVALRVRDSDPDLHRGYRPTDPVARLVFDLLEQLRVESRVGPELPGVRSNLRARHRWWSQQVLASPLAQSAAGQLLYAVAQICRSRLTGEAPPHGADDVIESVRFALAPLLSPALVELVRTRADQDGFARTARRLAEQVADLVAGLEDQLSPPGAAVGDGRRPQAVPDTWLLWDDADADALDDADELADADPSADDGLAERRRDGDAGPEGTTSTTDRARYRIFTDTYDQQRPTLDCVRSEVALDHRRHLDRYLVERGLSPGRVTRVLRARLGAPAPADPHEGRTEGRLDPRALQRLVTSFGDRAVFTSPDIRLEVDVAVGLLVDCSGSMKPHATAVTALVDLLTRGLDTLGCPCEVLGFTTAAWHGGRARRDWVRAGRPPHPGRLNERLHLVAKEARQPWRRARMGIAALMEPSIHREGLDGEAVAWAASRLTEHEAARRVLVLVSDGSPMDAATVQANDPRFLDRHLTATIAEIERAGQVTIVGVGVGLDTSAFLPRSCLLDLGPGLTMASVVEVADLLRAS